MTTNLQREKEILEKYTEGLASQKSLAIDNFIKDYIPRWQLKIITTLPFTKKLFGWEIVKGRDWDGIGERVELKRYGQNVAELKIIVEIKGLK